MIREERRHLGRALDVELGRLEAHPVRRVEVVARPHAQQHVVRLGLVAPHVVQVVRRDERQTDLRGEPEELLVEPPLLGQAVVLELEEEPVRAEDVAVLAGQLAGELPVLDFERARDLAVEAGRQADQAFAVPGEVLAVDARLVVVAVDVRVRDEPTQVQVAGPVLGEQDQVERLGVGLALLVGHRAPGDVRLHADDRLDVPGAAGLVERDRAVQRAVIGQGERIEALLGRRIDQLGDPAKAVEQAEFGVDVEVGEVVRGDGHAAVHGSQTGDYHAPMLDVTTTREAVPTPDGRSLDLYLGGPADGDALLFHIGTPSAPVPYEPAIRAMAERGLRYVAFSRPGYGSSTRRPGRSVGDVADDVETVLDHVGAATALTLGWSGGGPHALASAALLPDRVRAVATIGGVAPYPADGIDYLDGMGEENVEEFNAALDSAEALIVFKERSWPEVRNLTAAECADSFGDLIDHVDRAALTGEFAAWTAATMREAVRESYLGLVRRRHGVYPAMGLRAHVDPCAGPRLAGAPRSDGAVSPTANGWQATSRRRSRTCSTTRATSPSR